MIFPDKATIYIAAIEDGDYRSEKIDCAWAHTQGARRRLNAHADALAFG